MSERSRDLAKRFGAMETDRRVRDQIKLQDAARLIHEGPSLFDELGSELDKIAGELNGEPDMRGTNIVVDRRVVANQVRLRRKDSPRDAKVVYDPNLHVIALVLHNRKIKYPMVVRAGEHNVTIFDAACNAVTIEELADEILAAFLGG